MRGPRDVRWFSRLDGTRRVMLVVVVAAVSLSACSHTDTVSLPSSPSVTSPSPSQTPSRGASPSPAHIRPGDPIPLPPLPSPKPPADSHSMSGSSAARVGGAVDLSLDFQGMDPYSFWSGIGGQSSLSFIGPSGGSLSIGGLLQRGSQRTSSKVALSLSGSLDNTPFVFNSGDGSCRITVTGATDAGLEGSFRCDHVEISPGVTVTLAGTFSGSMPI